MTEILVPENAWEEEATGTISAWLYQDGEAVSAGDVVAELMVEKASYDLVAPASGTLKVLVEEEQPISKGSVIGRIV